MEEYIFQGKIINDEEESDYRGLNEFCNQYDYDPEQEKKDKEYKQMKNYIENDAKIDDKQREIVLQRLAEMYDKVEKEQEEIER